MTQTEPEWDAEERAWAFALLELDADRCGGCGHPLSETTDARAEDGYHAPYAMTCHACKAVALRRRDYESDPAPDSLLFSAHRRWRGGPDG